MKKTKQKKRTITFDKEGDDMADRTIMSFDWALKTVLRDKANFDVLEGFLSALLKQDIIIDTLIESESNQNNKGDKYNKVDLLSKDKKNNHIIIELQYKDENGYMQRVLYGVSKNIVENMKLGDDYLNVVKVISVSIIYFDISDADDYVYVGKTVFTGTHTGKELDLKEKYRKQNENIFPEYYIINVNKFKNVINDDLDEWIYAFKNSTVKDTFKSKNIDKLGDKLDQLKMTVAEKRKYDRYMENLSYYYGSFRTAREEGLSQGLSQGLAQGLEQGLAQGLAQGLTQGLAQGRAELLQSAKNALEMGLNIEQVAKITGLSEEHLKNILNHE